jgi:hypothetical protein
VKALAIISALIVGLVGGGGVWLNRWSHPAIQITPITSGEIGSRRLSPEETAALSDWLTAHPSGWDVVVATPPAPATVIDLHHAGDKTTTLSLFRSPPNPPGWTDTVWIMQYAAGGLTQGAIQKISDEDAKNLLRSIGK